MRIARMGMARIRRLMLQGAPQSLFLRELVTQPGAVGAISRQILAPTGRAHGSLGRSGGAGSDVVELGGGTASSPRFCWRAAWRRSGWW